MGLSFDDALKLQASKIDSKARNKKAPNWKITPSAPVALSSLMPQAQNNAPAITAAPAAVAVAAAPVSSAPSNIAQQDTFLDVPYVERFAAKNKGARWNPARKKWYAPAGSDLWAFNRWLPTPITPVYVPIEPLKVTIELVEGSNRIDVFFSREPSEDLRAKMYGAGFSCDSARVRWQGEDNNKARAFARAELGADLEDKPEPIAAPEIIVSDTVQASIPEASEPDDRDDSPFGIYKRQCAELCAELKIEFPDLALRAIDALHKLTFSN